MFLCSCQCCTLVDCQPCEAYCVIGDKMMDVVTALPPANGQTTAEVGDEDTY